ncbi:MAG TPA: DNA-3-methyladenine glycosylase [Bellilinea sp.]|nr:DNA-3-methyladenine glycosylase [Bellilinea sp.]
MGLSSCLPRDWYQRDPLVVARELLGMQLVRMLDGQVLRGVISETEAYRGEEDLACHARVGRTARTAVMYGMPGVAYVYFTYGLHWCLNAVCLPVDYPAAVLIRAIEPLDGLEVMAARRPGRPPESRTNGPAKLTQALGIDGRQNGVDLTSQAGGLWIEVGDAVPDEKAIIGPRVGINNVPEPWRSMPWRFRINKQ